MLTTAPSRPFTLPAGSPPLLMVVIDTEEEFDWSGPFSRAHTATESLAAQPLAQEVFERWGIVPTYAIDWPVATSGLGRRLLGGWAAEGRCEIAAHLHPWVNPPFDEPVNPANSFPGNLSPALEREKLARLTEAIARSFGRRPVVYKAGRYGLGQASAAILEELGYRVDVSIVPHTSYAADGGPDFSGHAPRPWWFGRARPMLEIPLTCGFAGALARHGPALQPLLGHCLAKRLRLSGIAARLGLLERLRLTPEGLAAADLKRLTASLLKQGCRLFHLTYHSPSLAPGNTPYTPDQAALERFLGSLEEYCRWFIQDLHGRGTTPSALYREALEREGRPC